MSVFYKKSYQTRVGEGVSGRNDNAKTAYFRSLRIFSEDDDEKVTMILQFIIGIRLVNENNKCAQSDDY